jgi:hypothetical protein
MADGDNPLRLEVEKVRERARARLRSLGIAEPQAEGLAQREVDEFMAKWGIKADMLGDPSAPRVAPAQPPARSPQLPPGSGMYGSATPMAPPAPRGEPEPRTVDLGSSPLRSPVDRSTLGEVKGPTKIGDLLQRAQQVAQQRPGAAAPPAVAGRPGAPPAKPPAPPSLADVLNRVRGGLPPAAAAPPAAPPAPAAPPPAAEPPALGPGGLRIRNMRTVDRRADDRLTPAGLGYRTDPSGAYPAQASPRRQELLAAFDRTYDAFQTMLEERMTVGDMALTDDIANLPHGGPAPPINVPSPEEILRLAEDLHRLMGDLRSMMSACEHMTERLGNLLAYYDQAGGAEIPA